MKQGGRRPVGLKRLFFFTSDEKESQILLRLATILTGFLDGRGPLLTDTKIAVGL